MVDHADTLHHYFRILRPDALEGCVRELKFNPANKRQPLRSGVAGQVAGGGSGRWPVEARRRQARERVRLPEAARGGDARLARPALHQRPR